MTLKHALHLITFAKTDKATSERSTYDIVDLPEAACHATNYVDELLGGHFLYSSCLRGQTIR